MRIFVTGATGFIGSAVIQELLRAGHQAVGLGRSEAAAAALKASGAGVHRGSLEDLESLKSGAANADGAIHLAFIHDFSRYAAAADIDRRAIETLGAVLKGSGRPLLVTSGTAAARTPGRAATEEDAGDPNAAAAARLPSETATLKLAGQGVRAMVVRLPPSVHGEGDHGFVPRLIAIAREKRLSAYVGDGHNRWPAVHRLDAARLYRLALEKGSAGARYHGVDDEGVPTREIADAIGRNLNLPVAAKSPQEAADHFGFLGNFFALDCPASSKQTQGQLGWRPVEPGLIADLEQGHYFEALTGTGGASGKSVS